MASSVSAVDKSVSQLRVQITSPALRPAHRFRRSQSAPSLHRVQSQLDLYEKRSVQPGPAPWFNDPKLQKRLDRETASVAHAGNDLRVLVNGNESFPAKLQAIANADLILLKTYAYDDDETGRCLTDALLARLAQGAKVFVQYEVKRNVGTLQIPGIWAGISSIVPPHLKRLADAGAVLVPNNRPDRLSRLVLTRDHEKYLITWRHGGPVRLFMGGMNVGDKWAFGGQPDKLCAALGFAHGLRDTDIELEGPAAEAAIDEFLHDAAVHNADALPALRDAVTPIDQGTKWLTYPKLQHGAVVRFIANRAQSEDTQYIKRMYRLLIDAVPAGETIRISNAYFLPKGELCDALVRAANRGVKVQLLLNARDTADRDARVVAWAAQSMYRDMLRACPNGNLEIYEWHGAPERGVSSIHQKVASFGTHGPFVVGSSNLDNESLYWNTEGVALIYDPLSRLRFDAMLNQDFREPHVHRVTLEELTQHPWYERLAEALLHHVGGYYL